jgi:multiple sugar transport system substrate-binding protein
MNTSSSLKGFTEAAAAGTSSFTRRNLSRRGFLAAAGGAVALATVACSGGKSLPGTQAPSGDAGSGTGTIQFWTDHSDDEVLNFKKVIASFTKDNPDIKVNLLNIADAAKYYTKVNTAAVGGNLADVYYARTFDIASFVDKQRVIPLTPLVDKDKSDVNPDDFWPAQVKQMSVSDQLYGLPYDFSNLAIYVNKTMFADAGVPVPTDDWTWDQFFEIGANFVQKSGSRQKRWGAGFQTYDWFMMGVFKSNGGDTFSEDLSKCVVNQSANVDFLTKLSDQMVKGVTPAPNATPAGVDPFAAGLVAMQVNGSWATAQTRTAVGSKFEWDVIRLPKGTTGKREVSAAGGSWVIPPTSKNQAAAWTFTKYLASKASQQVLIVDPLRSIPGRQSSAADWSAKAKSSNQPPKSIEIFPQQMQEDAVAWAFPKFWTEFDTIWGSRITTLGAGGDPAKILAQIQDDTNKAAAR